MRVQKPRGKYSSKRPFTTSLLPHLSSIFDSSFVVGRNLVLKIYDAKGFFIGVVEKESVSVL